MLSIEKHWTHTLLQTSRNYQTILTDDGGVSEEQQGVTQHHGGEQSVCTRYDLHRLDKYNRWDAPERARVVASWRTGAFPLSHWSPGHVVVVLLRIRQPISIAFLLYCDTHQVMMNLVDGGNPLFREGVEERTGSGLFSHRWAIANVSSKLCGWGCSSYEYYINDEELTGDWSDAAWFDYSLWAEIDQRDAQYQYTILWFDKRFKPNNDNKIVSPQPATFLLILS